MLTKTYGVFPTVIICRFLIMELNNTYFILRHGEAKSNKERFCSGWPEKIRSPLTEKGRKQIKDLIPNLKKENIDLIFSSDLLRTKQTAQIVAKSLGLKVDFDKRLREVDYGIFNGRSAQEWYDYFGDRDEAERVIKRPPKGENWKDIKKRMLHFLKDIDKKYKDKNILIVSHQSPLRILQAVMESSSMNGMDHNHKEKLGIKTGELRRMGEV